MRIRSPLLSSFDYVGAEGDVLGCRAISSFLTGRISVEERAQGGDAMVTNKVLGFVLSACMMFFALTLLGCIVAAVPLIIHATRGSSTSTATVLVNRDAASVYVDAMKVVKQRGFTQVVKQDDAKYFLEGTRKGKNATLQVIPVGSDQSRIIITVENDKDATGINEAVEATVQICRQLGLRCEEQKA
jgi:hypothetical protein